jgi:hypothetical protein
MATQAAKDLRKTRASGVEISFRSAGKARPDPPKQEETTKVDPFREVKWIAPNPPNLAHLHTTVHIPPNYTKGIIGEKNGNVPDGNTLAQVLRPDPSCVKADWYENSENTLAQLQADLEQAEYDLEEQEQVHEDAMQALFKCQEERAEMRNAAVSTQHLLAAQKAAARKGWGPPPMGEFDKEKLDHWTAETSKQESLLKATGPER